LNAIRHSIIRKALTGLFTAALVLLFLLPSFAAAPDLESGRSAVIYDISSGMPFSEANSLAQTPDGFLYAGCYGGLLRYDGREFYRYDGLTGIVSLLADSRGRLWIAADGLYCLENGVFTAYTTAEGLPSMAVKDVAEDSEGRIWAGTAGGLAYVGEDGSVHVPQIEALLGAPVESICAYRGPVAYGCTGDGDVFAVEGETLVAYHEASEFGEDISYACPDPDAPGMAYLSTSGSTLFYGDIRGPVSGLKRIDIPQLLYFNVMTKADGLLWACADNGIAYVDGSGNATVLENVPMTSTIYDVLCDHEGNMWFASTRQGLMKLSPNIFTDISASAGLSGRVVNSTWKKDGLLYAATDTGLVVLDENYELVDTPVTELLSAARVRAVKEDGAGRLWFCSFDKNALVCLTPEGGARVWNNENGLISNYARTIFERADGSMVLSVSGGVQFFRGGEPAGTLDSSGGLCSSAILSIGEDDGGTLYFGSNGEGLYRLLPDGRAEQFAGPDELSSGVILQIKNDPQRDIVWILTSNSTLYLKDGQLFEASNLPQEHIYDILFASDGSLWLMANNGYYVVRTDDVFSEGKADFIYYDAFGGASHMTTPNSRNYVSPEGDAIVACTDGIIGFNVDRFVNDHVDMLFAVPYAEADGERIYPNEKGVINVPASAQRITVYAYALSYALGDPKLSYRLEGFDRESYVTDRKGLEPPVYTNLPGGRYRFVMSTEGGREYSVEISKHKLLHEYAAFWIGLFALMVLLTALVALLLLRRQAALAAKKREMERIGKELDMAAGIQADMLPRVFPAFPQRGEFDLYASMEPAKEVGGDFYDFFLVDDDHLALVVADVSGKGVPAALFMMISKTVLKNTAGTGASPAEVLSEVNAQLCDNNKNNMFVTVWLGILEISTGKLTWADGGHEKPLLYHDGSWSFVKKHMGIALAMMEPELFDDDDPPYVDQQLQLEPGDVLFQYTDGIPEATDAHGKLFGDERLLAAACSAPAGDPEKLLPHIRACVEAFVKGTPQFDDMTMLALRYNGPSGAGKEGGV